MWIEDSTASGYDAYILHLVNQHTGANFTLVVGNWAEIVDKAKVCEIDGLSTSAVHNERAKYFGPSRNSGEGGSDFEEEVFFVPEAVGHSFDHLDFVVDPFKQITGIF